MRWSACTGTKKQDFKVNDSEDW